MLFNFLSRHPFLGALPPTISGVAVKESHGIFSPFWASFFGDLGIIIGILVGVTALIINVRKIYKQ